MFIQVQTENVKRTVFKLNDSTAARELYAQLPLTIKVEDYSSNEKIFYPPKKLGTANTPLADAKAGTLAYFAPWGDVVMFYDRFGSYKGLYLLGEAVSGSEYISQMSGLIQVEKSEPLN
nr:cyclophilin-like fold protein [uncultured Desulfobulbus sp.]